MPLSLPLILSFVAVAAIPHVGWAQSKEHDAQRRQLALKTPEATSEGLLELRSPRITRALQSPESLYVFVTRPESFYRERRAAALQGKGLIPMSWMPRLWAAMRELQRGRTVQDWGLKPHPISSMSYDFRAWLPAPPPVQTVLGHRWTAPRTPMDYPLTPDERENAPWPWQVEAALFDLYGGLVASTIAPLEREKSDAYLAAVAELPCTTDEEAQSLVTAAQYSSHRKTPAVMGALRNIALNPSFTLAPIHASTTFADATRLWDDSLSWAIGVAGTRDILRDSPHSRARDNAAYGLRSLRERFRWEGTARMPVPAAAILEAARLALDTTAGDNWHRLYVFAFSVVEAVDDPPFPAERNMDTQSPMVKQLLAEFGKWFESAKVGLTEMAASQSITIDAAGRALETRTCRG